MKYSKQVLKMLEDAVTGKIDDFWDFSFDFNALFGEDEEFADAWYEENPEMFDILNDYEVMMFLEEHDTSDKQGYIDFLTTYYEKVKDLVK
ncbi:MAG: hypothetical protein Q3988_04470 [Gemella sp.]|nr:hypothetical protein [Gemella sp.]